MAKTRAPLRISSLMSCTSMSLGCTGSSSAAFCRVQAEAFADWVTEEVLPAIKRTGRYVHGASTNSNDSVEMSAKNWADVVKLVAERVTKRQRATIRPTCPNPGLPFASADRPVRLGTAVLLSEVGTLTMHLSTRVPVKVQPRSKWGSAALAPNKSKELQRARSRLETALEPWRVATSKSSTTTRTSPPIPTCACCRKPPIPTRACKDG